MAFSPRWFTEPSLASMLGFAAVINIIALFGCSHMLIDELKSCCSYQAMRPLTFLFSVMNPKALLSATAIAVLGGSSAMVFSSPAQALSIQCLPGQEIVNFRCVGEPHGSIQVQPDELIPMSPPTSQAGIHHSQDQAAERKARRQARREARREARHNRYWDRLIRRETRRQFRVAQMKSQGRCIRGWQWSTVHNNCVLIPPASTIYGPKLFMRIKAQMTTHHYERPLGGACKRGPNAYVSCFPPVFSSSH